ncbi:acyltransferase [Kribbella solani]|uniref:acyltransferase family protein n=1 Tax=Kribbella solani TaxID=236067 RepID=UPI0029A8E237|nr:acyltransferase [Kribbella solani]MDX2969393.1 acyltransferase [Kribbella solani]MDX3002950.1 acyltransferase [Kribbella solani]
MELSVRTRVPAGRPDLSRSTVDTRTRVGGQLPSLTGMRWIAAFAVFVYHVRNFGYFGPGHGGRLVNWAFGAGAAGVSFFFILSGFVLAWSARPTDQARRFWRRRLARVYPVHLVTAVIAAVLAYTLVPGLRPGSLNEAAANLLLVSSWKAEWWQALNPVSWSLVCEAFFYATFPLLYAGLRRLPARALFAIALASGALVMFLPWANTHYALGWTLYSSPPARLPEFVLGVALGLLVKAGAWRGPGLDVSLAITLIGYFLTAQVAPEYGYAACTVIGLSLLIPAAATTDLAGTPTFWRHPTLVRLGEWSFAFYMIHLLVMATTEAVLGTHPNYATAPALVATAATFTISLTLAWALHTHLETPARHLLLRPWHTHGLLRGVRLATPRRSTRLGSVTPHVDHPGRR